MATTEELTEQLNDHANALIDWILDHHEIPERRQSIDMLNRLKAIFNTTPTTYYVQTRSRADDSRNWSRVPDASFDLLIDAMEACDQLNQDRSDYDYRVIDNQGNVYDDSEM